MTAAVREGRTAKREARKLLEQTFVAVDAEVCCADNAAIQVVDDNYRFSTGAAFRVCCVE